MKSQFQPLSFYWYVSDQMYSFKGITYFLRAHTPRCVTSFPSYWNSGMIFKEWT